MELEHVCVCVCAGKLRTRVGDLEIALATLLDALSAQEKRAAEDSIPSFSIRVNACRRDAKKVLEEKS